MDFGKKIKKLRNDSGMTQECLAELLDISPQAVSRWENNAAMPDISLLVPVANLFGVTTDYLLGMDTYQKDLRRKEFDEAYQDYWKNHLQYSLLSKACWLCESKRYDEAVTELQKARRCAEEMSRFRKKTGYRFTAPLSC